MLNAIDTHHNSII